MIVSIDIGTSNSSICMMGADGKIMPVDVRTGASMYGSEFSLPSAAFVEDSGNLVLGQAAMNNRMLKPQNFRAEFKRNLGENYPIVLGPRSFLPEELYTEFFRYLVSCVRKLTNEPIELAYLTYPATYGTSKKEKIVAAAKAAGLFHTELMDEPSAAAMNYCAEGHVQDKQNLLIYDFGGGTFDVSLIRYENGEFRSLTGALGLERCGGVDIDRMIFQDMMSKIPADTLEMLKKNELYYMRFVSQLSESAVKCKQHLSNADIYSENIMVGFEAVSYSLTLERFNQMIAGLVGQTIQTCRQILAGTKLQVSDLSAVLLVGGTSRVRLVREMVEQMAGSVPVYNAANLELIVSQGALNYRNYKVAPPKPEPEPEETDTETTVFKMKHTVFSVNQTSVEDGTVTVFGSVCGSGMIEDLDHFAVYDNEGNLLGDCRAVVFEGGNAIYSVTSDSEDVTIQLCDFTGEVREDMEIDYLISMPVGENTYDQAIADLEDDGFITTRVNYQYENVEGRIDFQDAYFFYVTEISDGKIHGRSISGKIDDDHMEQYVYRKDDDTKGFRQKLNWERHTATGHNAYFEADCSNVRVGDIITDCILPDGHTFEGEKLSSWRYRLTVKNLNHEPVASEDDFNDDSDEMDVVPGDINAAQKIFRRGRELTREKKWDQAFACFFKAARMGHTEAQYSVANCYAQGLGTIKDDELASIWYLRATESRIKQNNQPNDGTISGGQAEQIDVSRENDPIWLDETGMKYSREGQWRKAFECFEKAAKMDYANAQYHLAGCYERGDGTNRNLQNARTWYGWAANHGHTAAADKLKQLQAARKPKAKQTPEQIIRKLLKEMPSVPGNSDDSWSVEKKKALSSVLWMEKLKQRSNVPNSDKVLIAKDMTIFGKGNSGVILTNKGIYEKSLFSPRFIPWNSFAREKLDIRSDGFIAYNGLIIGGSASFGADGKAFWTRLHEELRKIY